MKYAFLSFATLLTALAMGMMSTSDPPARAEDRQAVAETVTLVAHLADTRDWDTLKSLYADTVTFDYTALNGGETTTGSSAATIDGWAAFLPGFDRTQHLLGPVVVTLGGDKATAEVHLRARHEIDGADGGTTWIVGGHYVYRLRRDAGTPRGWRIVYHELADPYVEGNTELPALAQERMGG